MMKAVAVPYIIAILLGVGVIGLVGYWLFISGGQFGGGAAAQQCRSDFLQTCQRWASGGYSTNSPNNNGVFINENDNTCLKQVTGSATAFPDNAASKGTLKDKCSAVGA